MGLKINTLIFWIGLLFSLLTFLTAGLFAMGYAVPIVLIRLLMFIGEFLSGWALLGFAVMKEMLARQRLIAFLFAIILLASVFSVSVTFGWSVFHLH